MCSKSMPVGRQKKGRWPQQKVPFLAKDTVTAFALKRLVTWNLQNGDVVCR